jgi:hypothetical protein
VRPELLAIAGVLPAAAPTRDGRARRTDEFRWLHAEFTSVFASEEGATW